MAHLSFSCQDGRVQASQEANPGAPGQAADSLSQSSIRKYVRACWVGKRLTGHVRKTRFQKARSFIVYEVAIWLREPSSSQSAICTDDAICFGKCQLPDILGSVNRMSLRVREEDVERAKAI
ncbi:hypothetical protein PHSY_005842 [Pseudozyma hubeiensis SY62]|uniref:Uncharacterized protein n=1 Tax=Pseudozyma hubeiensis (strain SY62) TaxID=1305764 RepID=R9PA51_PSEHS|nr:hypothetical protein PHSY_005842 [Pseudozyma hubeiensis SY62]GAC98253.1 hypothetical protein PHSY_005842 [Pseudozyma hubeiensis SY62]